MEDRARMIAAARRSARRVARESHISYQQALDQVARDLGRVHWAAFMADPTLVPREVLGVCISKDALIDMNACALVAQVYDYDRKGDDPAAVYVLMHDLTAHVALEACTAFHRRPQDVMDAEAMMRDAGVSRGCLKIRWTDRTADYIATAHHGLSVLREIPAGVRIDPGAWAAFCAALPIDAGGPHHG